MTGAVVPREQVDAYRRDGAVVLPGLLTPWLDLIERGIERNLATPGPYASENSRAGERGRFFDDYCNWQRIPEFAELLASSPAAAAAGALMQSGRVQFFHDHVLVKEGGTDTATPWHQDAPYYFVDGTQNVSFWIPVDAVRAATLRIIRGSHRWPRLVLPTRWLTEQSFYAESEDFMPVPDPDLEPDRYEVLEWPMEPGDVLAFHYRAVHGARGNPEPIRRRALSLRFVGEDARFVERPGPTSPPFPGHGMTTGDRLREDWFPLINGSLPEPC